MTALNVMTKRLCIRKTNAIKISTLRLHYKFEYIRPYFHFFVVTPSFLRDSHDLFFMSSGKLSVRLVHRRNIQTNNNPLLKCM